MKPLFTHPIEEGKYKGCELVVIDSINPLNRNAKSCWMDIKGEKYFLPAIHDLKIGEEDSGVTKFGKFSDIKEEQAKELGFEDKKPYNTTAKGNLVNLISKRSRGKISDNQSISNILLIIVKNKPVSGIRE